ncbi:hypothetical protein FHX09_003062 [Rhizobium sp. BK538]|nr:hypothetical protein [Rhizobium sp. BK538]
MMREPARLLREMGAGGFLMFQLLIAGMLLSSLTHPWLIMLLVKSAGYLALGFPPPGAMKARSCSSILAIWQQATGSFCYMAGS